MTKLSLDPALQRQNQESARIQAERIFAYLKLQLVQEPTKKIALLYAANNQQAEKFHEAYQKKPETLPAISGGGQAKVFSELIILINNQCKAHPELEGRLRVLPIATSLYGGSNGPGNSVALEHIKRDLLAVEYHLNNGYDVVGIPNYQNHYAIGGLNSNFWFKQTHTAIHYQNTNYSQGDFVQLLLEKLEKRQETPITLEKVFQEAKTSPGLATLHYKFATLPSEKARSHRYTLDPNEFSGIKEKYRALRGDALKTAILIDIKTSLEAAQTRDEVEDKIKEFEQSAEYKVLAKAQDFFTSFFHLNTSSISAYKEMIEEIKIANSTTHHQP